MSALAEARAEIREKLDWDGSSQIVLSREHAEAILAGPTEPVAVLDEIMRLAALLTKEHVESYAEAGGIKAGSHYRFTCKCGTDWMTVLPGVDTCQVCYHMGQPDIVNWIVGTLRCDCSSPNCNGGCHGQCNCERC